MTFVILFSSLSEESPPECRHVQAPMMLLVLPDYSTEDRLLAEARAGDSTAVMHIYEQYFGPVFQYIRLRVGDAAHAEDLASEVFVRLVKALQTGKAPRDTLRGWLFQVARNLIYDHHGQQRRLPLTSLAEWMPAPHDDHPEQQVLQTLSTERLHRALRMLAADQQEVVILRFGQMLSLQETADIMGKSVSAIKALQFRAVQTLRSLLEEAA